MVDATSETDVGVVLTQCKYHIWTIVDYRFVDVIAMNVTDGK